MCYYLPKENLFGHVSSLQQAKPSSLPWQPVAPSNSSLPASYSNGQSKVVAWLQESEEMDKCAEGKCDFCPHPGNKSDSTPEWIK